MEYHICLFTPRFLSLNSINIYIAAEGVGSPSCRGRGGLGLDENELQSSLPRHRLVCLYRHYPAIPELPLSRPGSFFSMHITICSSSPLMWLFKLLSLSKVNWLLEEKKRNRVWKCLWIGQPDWALAYEKKRGSSQCQRRRKCYRKHPLDICVSDVSSQKFLTLFHRWSVGVFQADSSNSHCRSVAIQAGFGATICTVILISLAFLRLHKQGGKKGKKLHDNFIHC